MPSSTPGTAMAAFNRHGRFELSAPPGAPPLSALRPGHGRGSWIFMDNPWVHHWTTTTDWTKWGIEDFNVGKTMLFLPAMTGFMYTTYKNGDLGVVYGCLWHWLSYTPIGSTDPICTCLFFPFSSPRGDFAAWATCKRDWLKNSQARTYLIPKSGRPSRPKA